MSGKRRSNRAHSNKQKSVSATQKNTSQSPQQSQQYSSGRTLTIKQTQGPLPEPATLQQYDQIVPGAAGRIISMAEQDAEHQREMQRRVLRTERAERRLGQIFGFGIGIVGLAAATYCASIHANVVAGAIGGSTVLGLVAVFVTGRFVKN